MSLSQKSKRIRLPKSEAEITDILHESGRTDSANAERFVERFEGRVLFVPQWGRWLTWDGRRWRDDFGVGIMNLAKKYAKTLWAEIGAAAEHVDREELGTLQTFVKASNQASKIEAFVSLARSDPRIVVDVSELNTQHESLNVLNGTLNLRTGQLRPHKPRDRLTLLAKVRFDPNADCPNWKEMLNLIFDGDQELIRYVQQLAGYSASGLTGEHLILICHGSGNNGKSTFWNVLASILGDYASAAPQELLLPVGTQHPTIIADLYHKRFVSVAESDQNRKFAEAVAKSLSGGDRIKARRMREDFWEFDPTHKIWISTNHKPKITGRDCGIWRRIRLIPFTVDISQKTTPKPGFATWLAQNEGSGVLNWLVQGFQDWQENGFIQSKAVQEATANYRENEDTLGEFLREHCVQDSNGVALATELYAAYQADGGQWSKTAFGRAMAERFEKEKPKSGPNRDKVIYKGIRLGQEDAFASHPHEEIPGETQLGISWDQLPQETLEICADPLEHSEKLVPTSPADCPTCKTPLVPGPEVSGWINWDCNKCGHVQPRKVVSDD